MGKKYDDLSRKSTKLKEKWWKNGGKEEIFTVLREKKYFENKGGAGQKNLIFGPCIFKGDR